MELEVLRKVIAKIMGMDPNEIEPDMTFLNDLGADSLDLYQILKGVEDELNITVPTDSLQDVKTIGDAVDLIKNVD